MAVVSMKKARQAKMRAMQGNKPNPARMLATIFLMSILLNVVMFLITGALGVQLYHECHKKPEVVFMGTEDIHPIQPVQENVEFEEIKLPPLPAIK